MKTSSWDRRATSRAASAPLSFGRAARSAFVLLVGLLGASCGASSRPAPPVASAPALRAPVDFAFESIDERPLSSATTRGAPTILTFVTTSSLPSQAQIDFLIAMAKRDGDRIHYAAVALDGPDSRELVELYRKALSIPFPIAVADGQTLAGATPFGDVTAVPVTVVLDAAGRIAWRAEGRVAKSDELRRELRGLSDRGFFPAGVRGRADTQEEPRP